MSQETGTPVRELLVWAFAILCGGVVLLSPVVCTMSRQHTIAEAVKNGVDPIAAKCAIEGDTGYAPMCLAYVMKPKQ